MPYKLLLVDDDREFREEFKDCFGDYEMIEAGDGDQALAILKKPNEIDLVILDVRLPTATGTEILSEIKGKYPGLRVIILTGHSSEDVAIEALKARADDYLSKPLNLKKTKEAIDNLLEAKEEEKNPGKSTIEAKVERVKHFAERNCYKKVSLNDAAALVALSPKYLSRIFKDAAGTGFNEYRLQIKIKEAKALLTTTRLNVDQISEKLGYQNTESFIRAFKKITHQTPSKYREKNKKDMKNKKAGSKKA